MVNRTESKVVDYTGLPENNEIADIMAEIREDFVRIFFAASIVLVIAGLPLTFLLIEIMEFQPIQIVHNLLAIFLISVALFRNKLSQKTIMVCTLLFHSGVFAAAYMTWGLLSGGITKRP